MLGSKGKGLAQLPNARKKLWSLGIPWDETKEFHELQPTKKHYMSDMSIILNLW
jgi:hypothetical protein